MSPSRQSPVRLVIETDFYSDVDDVGALAIAHYFAGIGEAEIVAIGINTPSRFGVAAVQTVNEFYGRGSIPIGAFHARDDSRAQKDYASTLAVRAQRAPDNPESAMSVLRRALAEAEPDSLTMVSIGFLSNLALLLASPPDNISELPGNELVQQKVHRSVIMGGEFPQGAEFNFVQDIPSAQAVLKDWPGRIEFLGWETGVDVITGTQLSSSRLPDNPVALAYERYSGPGKGRHSWDLQTVDIAVRGPGDRYSVSRRGTVELTDQGVSTFRESTEGTHFVHTLIKPRALIADELDEFLNRSWTLQA